MCKEHDANAALVMPNAGDEEKDGTTEGAIYYGKVLTELNSYNLDDFSY